MYDGDLIFTTNNEILLKRHRKLPAILCIQRTTEKIIPTEESILKTNFDAMGNKVGSITNRVTSMMDKQSYFEKDSKEYLELQKRIESGQHFQQLEIDRLKGIVAAPMPDYWYMPGACKDDDYLYSICTHKKPYFMMYVYDTNRREYAEYIKKEERYCLIQYGKTLDEILAEGSETEYIAQYYKYLPLSDGPCTMNQICHYIESVFNGRKHEMIVRSNFSYDFMKYLDVDINEEIRSKLKNLADDYCAAMSRFKTDPFHKKDDYKDQEMILKRKYRYLSEQYCPDEKMRLNIALEIGFENKFLWLCAGDLVVNRLKELNT